MNILKKISLMVSLFVASFAVQATYDFGTLVSNTEYSHGFSTVSDDVDGGYMIDFDFSLDGPVIGAIAALAIDFTNRIQTLELTVTNLDTSEVYLGHFHTHGSMVKASGLSDVVFVMGSYSATVSGYASPNSQVGITANLAVSAVPEPSVLGLMFGGLGLVGLVAFRVRQA